VFELPRATPLIYAFSQIVAPLPGYYPASVSAAGFWVPKIRKEGEGGVEEIASSIPEYVRVLFKDQDQDQDQDQDRSGVLYVGFGSMAALGLNGSDANHNHNPNLISNPNLHLNRQSSSLRHLNLLGLLD